MPITPQPLTTNELPTLTEEFEVQAIFNSADAGVERLAELPVVPIGGRRTLNARHIHDRIWEEIFDWYAIIWCTFRATAPSAMALVLGQVCQQWRELALLMPQLWNHLPIVHITQQSLDDKYFTEGWAEFLHRSGRLPLKLHLSFEIPVDQIPHKPYASLTPFFDCSSRWEHLTISGLMVMQAQVHFEPIHKRLPHLRSLTLNSIKTTFDFLPPSTGFAVFEFAPRLTKINLHSPSRTHKKSRLGFPFSQLTKLKETGIDIGSFPLNLELCEQLQTIHYRCRNFTYRPMNAISQFNLRHLLVEAKHLDQFWRHLAGVTLPALETFSLIALQQTPQRRLPHLSTLRDLIIRSACRLKKLVLDFGCNPIDSIGAAALFVHTDHLESLELGDCYGPDFYEHVLQGLIIKGNRSTILPRLQSLTLNYDRGFGLRDSVAISEIVSSREKVVVDDSHPGRRILALKCTRISVSGTYDRYHAMHQLGGWEDPLGRMFDPILERILTPADIVMFPPVHHVINLVEKVRNAHQDEIHVPQTLTPEHLSLFTLAYLIEDADLRKDTLNNLGNLDTLSTVQFHTLRHSWIPGCMNDILYVHPDYSDTVTRLGLWRAILGADVKQLSFLGYQLMKEPEDDLMDGEHLW